MTTVKELGLEPTLKEEEEEPICSICCGELTVKNIVNPECGHATCKECFWRWAKDKNSCPFCRTSLLKNDEEAQDIQQMRQLLEHRTRIIKQVEDAYDEEENLKRKATRLTRKCRNLEEAWEGAKSLVAAEKGKLEELKRVNGGTYQTFKYFKGKIVEICVKDRHKREKIDEASMNLAHGANGMCMEVLRDIKILGRAAGGPWEYGWFCKPKLDKVREMNRVRKERRKFQQEIVTHTTSLRALFEENTSQPQVRRHRHWPIERRMNDLQEFFRSVLHEDSDGVSPEVIFRNFINNNDISNNRLSEITNNIPFGMGNTHINISGYIPGLAHYNDDAMPPLEPMSPTGSDMSIDSDDIPELE